MAMGFVSPVHPYFRHLVDHHDRLRIVRVAARLVERMKPAVAATLRILEGWRSPLSPYFEVDRRCRRCGGHIFARRRRRPYRRSARGVANRVGMAGSRRRHRQGAAGI